MTAQQQTQACINDFIMATMYAAAMQVARLDRVDTVAAEELYLGKVSGMSIDERAEFDEVLVTAAMRLG